MQKVYAINEFGEGIEGFNLLQIKELVPNPNHPSWIDDKLGRQLLFLKLELKDRIDHYYLIDIHKNRNHEAFCAFLIITPYRLTGEQISKICEPYRVCRRVNILRDYHDDKIKIYP